MGDRDSSVWRSRWLICLAAAALAACAIFVVVLMLVSEIECDPDQLETVACDDERAGAWGPIRGLLMLGILFGLIPAATLAISRRAWAPLGAYAAVTPLAVIAWGLIGEIEVEDRPVPNLTRAELLAPGCSLSKQPRCDDGIPVRLDVDDDAEVVFSIGLPPEQLKDRTFETTAIGLDSDSGSRAYSFDAGTHEVSLTAEVVRVGPLSPPGSLGTWPPGRYELMLTIEPDEGGNQVTEDVTYEAAFTVEP